MKSLILFLIIVLSVKWSCAQKNGNIAGVIVDGTNKKNPIPLATVSLYKLNDSVIIAYGLSDDKGNFKLSGLPTNVNYKLVVNAWRFNIFRKEVRLNSAEESINVDSIFLSPRMESINEVLISAERPPIIVRNDTIEFNAESFKTLPTAFVEDLFKKLPGFELRADGTVQVNGKIVSRILVDGREFFGGDMAIAMKQLPAFVVDKVQVAEDVIAKRKDPDLAPERIPQIINLTLKKSAKKGAFGKVYAGNALEKFYEAGGILNIFRDTTQVSVLAYGNNINRTGFSFNDINKIGGFDRSGSRYYSLAADGSFIMDNMSFGGGGIGIQQSSGGGANFNTLTKKGIKINGRYFYGHSDSDIEDLVNNDQTIGSGHLISKSTSFTNNRFNYHNFGGKVEWNASKTLNLTISSAISFSPIKFQSSVSSLTSDGQNQLFNSAETQSHRLADNAQYNLYGDLYKSFMKKGRSLSASFSLSNMIKRDDFYNSSNTFLNSLPGNNLIIDQLRQNALETFNSSIYANYSEPLSKTMSLSSTLNAEYLNDENGLTTLYFNPLNNLYDILVPNFSETVVQSGIKVNIRERIRWTISKTLSIQPGVTLGQISLNNTFKKFNAVQQNYTFLLPALNVRYKSFTFDYSTSFSEPNISYLQPVANNTDPLFIQNGNGNLLPTKFYKFSGRYSKYNPKRFISLNVLANWNIISNGIFFSRVIDNEGVQTTKPLNSDNTWEQSIGGGAFKSYKFRKTRLLISTTVNMSYNKSFIDINTVLSEVYNYSIAPQLGFNLNLNDKIELSEYYGFSKNQSDYTGAFQDRSFLRHSHTAGMIIRFPKKIVFDTQLRYLQTNQKFLDYKNTISMWDVGATLLFLKNDRGQLKLSVNDILQSNIRRNTIITENIIRNTQSNALGRYMLLTFNYNIQNFGPVKSTGKNLLGF